MDGSQNFNNQNINDNNGNQNVNNVNNQNMGNTQFNNSAVRSNERQGRGLFYGVIALAVFIIMAVGATFAYFAASAGSANNSITTGSTSLSLSLISYEQAWMKDELIPVDYAVVQYAFANQDDTTMQTNVVGTTCYNSDDEEVSCDDDSVARTTNETEPYEDLRNSICVDDYGNEICSVYVFQIVNDNASPQTMSFKITTFENSFVNLYAIAYEISIDDDALYTSTDNNNGFGDPDTLSVVENGATIADSSYNAIYVNRAGLTKTLLAHNGSYDELDTPLSVSSGITSTIATGVSIDSNETKTFAVVLYIKNLSYAQDDDEESSFTGSIDVTTGDGAGVSGYISAVVNNGD